MSKRKCVRCGKDPADGFASLYQGGVERWYCHGDEETDVSCYIDAALSTGARTFEDRFADAIRRDQETGALPKPEPLTRTRETPNE